MSISNQVFKISGEKAESLVIAENALQIMSSAYNDINSFNEAWNKKITLVTKAEIKFDTIKSITQEDGENDIVVKYKGMAGIGSERKFSFDNPSDLADFYAFFQQEKGYTRTDENLSPIKAITPSLLGLAITIAVTLYGYTQAASMAAGTYVASEGGSRGARRGRFLDSIFGMLGTTGVLLVGIAISAYFGYTIWNRYKNPPVQIKLSNPA